MAHASPILQPPATSSHCPPTPRPQPPPHPRATTSALQRPAPCADRGASSAQPPTSTPEILNHVRNRQCRLPLRLLRRVAVAPLILWRTLYLAGVEELEPGDEVGRVGLKRDGPGHGAA